MSQGGKMTLTKPKIAGIAIGAAMILTGAFAGLEPPPDEDVYFFIVLAMALITFPEEIGRFTGSFLHLGHPVDTKTPGCAVAGFGWLLLVVAPLYYCFVERSIGP